MESLTEDAFRELLDAKGILRPGAMAAPSPDGGWSVFAQSPDVRLDMETIQRHGVQFFATKLGLTTDKQYDVVPEVDVARFVVFGVDAGAAGTRLCYGRAVEKADVIRAEEAERTIGTYGLALLAQRCKTLWLVVQESHEDRVALTLAVILASTLLGPIVSPDGREILGVRSGRRKLEGAKSPYR